jgi:hypothetical protein
MRCSIGSILIVYFIENCEHAHNVIARWNEMKSQTLFPLPRYFSSPSPWMHRTYMPDQPNQNLKPLIWNRVSRYRAWREKDNILHKRILTSSWRSELILLLVFNGNLFSSSYFLDICVISEAIIWEWPIGMHSNSERDLVTCRKCAGIEMEIAREMSIWMKPYMGKWIAPDSTFFRTNVLIRWSMSASTFLISLGCPYRPRLFLSGSFVRIVLLHSRTFSESKLLKSVFFRLSIHKSDLARIDEWIKQCTQTLFPDFGFSGKAIGRVR